MWKAENYNARLGAARWRCRKEEKKSGKLECALLSDVYSVVIWRESCANKQCVLPYPRPVMTWTNLMPLQYLKTPTAALYYRQVALLKKNSRKLQEWKKDRQEKKLMNFDDSANDELEFEKWMFWFLVCRVFPHAKNKHCIDAEINFCSQAKMP